MKFPLYNECPNCGHPTDTHPDQTSSFPCNVGLLNQPIWREYDALKEKYDSSCPHDQEELAKQMGDVLKRIYQPCDCHLSRQDVRHAIAMQAAVEVALARAGVEITPAALVEDDEELRGGYHSCDGPCCEKRPGEYCKDDDCNCGAAGNHATLPKP